MIIQPKSISYKTAIWQLLWASTIAVLGGIVTVIIYLLLMGYMNGFGTELLKRIVPSAFSLWPFAFVPPIITVILTPYIVWDQKLNSRIKWDVGEDGVTVFRDEKYMAEYSWDSLKTYSSRKGNLIIRTGYFWPTAFLSGVDKNARRWFKEYAKAKIGVCRHSHS